MSLFSKKTPCILKRSTLFWGAFLLFVSNSSASSISENRKLCLTPSENKIQVCEEFLPAFDKKSLSNENGFSFSTNNIDRNAALTERSGSVLYNYVKMPDEGKDYGSYFLSFVAIIISLLIPAWQRMSQKKDALAQKKDAINDGFWLREVVMPQININMFNTCASFRNKLSLSPADFTTAYDEILLPSLNELRDSFSLLTAFSDASHYPALLNQLCDDLEDDVGNNILKPYAERKEDISKFQIKLTKMLIEAHKKIS